MKTQSHTFRVDSLVPNTVHLWSSYSVSLKYEERSLQWANLWPLRKCGHSVFVPGHLRSVSRSDPRCSCGDKAFLSSLSVAVTQRCDLFRQLRIILFFFCSFVDFCHFSQEFTGKGLPALYFLGVANTMELCDQRYPMIIFLPSTDKRCSWNWESNSTQKRESFLLINGPQRSAYALVLMQVLMHIGGNIGTSGRGLLTSSILRVLMKRHVHG